MKSDHIKGKIVWRWHALKTRSASRKMV